LYSITAAGNSKLLSNHRYNTLESCIVEETIDIIHQKVV